MTLGSNNMQATEFLELFAFLGHLVFFIDLTNQIVPDILRDSRRVGYSFCSRDQASVSGLPPSTISVPRPAMLVAMVTAPRRPA